ncbi:glycosyltransferase [Subtercola sp. PAMC28395]|uniref:glycosyltransferase n=1 Tax=Subtercola sp. PAMC28395 TaxID=2846775 RepID=UPI001C0B97AA|nr:glycosyltransferase [Subtercola sp. PAMC28395]QWT23660.1 glycosyltransferase [Subtercola sp. PAMC28395]
MIDSTPGPTSPGPSVIPPVTAVLAVRNDAQTIERAVRSIFAQQYPLELAVVIASAPSTDGTREIVRALASGDPRLSVIETTSASPAVALNEAIAAATSAVLIRVDPRSELPSDYVRVAVEAMARTDAAALVGRTRPVGETPFERAVATGFRHRLGLADDPLRSPGQAEGPTGQPNDHVLRRRMFIDAGLYSEELRHGQSWEMNSRLRDAGNTVWFTPELVYSYRPPSRAVALTRALFADGLWRGEFFRAFRDESALRFRLPVAIVIATIAGFILGAIGLFGIVAGALGAAFVVSVILFALILAPAAYVVVVLTLAGIVAVREDLRTGAWFALVMPFIHFSWGLGFIAGFLNIEGAADTLIVDFE